MDLSRSLGRSRLLLIFAPSASDEGAEKQRDLLEGHEEVGFADRALLVLRLFEEGTGDAAGGRPVAPEEAGAAKLRSGAETDATDLFARIDATPMRRREARKKG